MATIARNELRINASDIVVTANPDHTRHGRAPILVRVAVAGAAGKMAPLAIEVVTDATVEGVAYLNPDLAKKVVKLDGTLLTDDSGNAIIPVYAANLAGEEVGPVTIKVALKSEPSVFQEITVNISPVPSKISTRSTWYYHQGEDQTTDLVALVQGLGKSGALAPSAGETIELIINGNYKPAVGGDAVIRIAGSAKPATGAPFAAGVAFARLHAVTDKDGEVKFSGKGAIVREFGNAAKDLVFTADAGVGAIDMYMSLIDPNITDVTANLIVIFEP